MKKLDITVKMTEEQFNALARLSSFYNIPMSEIIFVTVKPERTAEILLKTMKKHFPEQWQEMKNYPEIKDFHFTEKTH
jgi:methylglyoxal synthase